MNAICEVLGISKDAKVDPRTKAVLAYLEQSHDD